MVIFNTGDSSPTGIFSCGRQKVGMKLKGHCFNQLKGNIWISETYTKSDQVIQDLNIIKAFEFAKYFHMHNRIQSS